MAHVKDLQEFLVGAELQHYHDCFVKDLKVNTVPQIKYVDDEDLMGVGMSKPEIRRLRRFFSKECPKGALSKLKKILAKNPSDPGPGSPPSLEKQPHFATKSSNKHIILEDAITVHKTIGTGEFGIVQQGVWTNDSGEQILVAVKCLAKEKLHAQTSDFLQEATIMHSLDHPHVVQLFGVVLSADCLMLVTELAPLRSLLECLKEATLRSSFSVSILCDLSIQIADGMSYLESRRLIHRDLAARNVLMFARDKIKISDFGLSRALGMEQDYYQCTDASTKLPIAWCAPECINFLKFTSASDVWSFGVTLWEMFSYGAQPWEGLTGEQIIQGVDQPLCRRLPQPDHCPDDWYAVMTKCWLLEPSERPKFSDLLSSLQQMKPARVIATVDFSNDGAVSSFLAFKTNDVVTVLSKMPDNSPRPGLWRGVFCDGPTAEPGYFDPVQFSPYVEISAAPMLRKSKVARSGSSRLSVRNTRKLTPSMISAPQSDLRHIGHVGYDGAVFGDVSFIGDNYNKLPIKVGNTRKSTDDMSASYPAVGQTSPFSSAGATTPSTSSVLMGTGDSLAASGSCDFDDFADFKMPDFSTGFDLGSSLMDEVMTALRGTSDDSGSGFLLEGLTLGSADATDRSSKDLPTNHVSTNAAANHMPTNHVSKDDSAWMKTAYASAEADDEDNEIGEESNEEDDDDEDDDAEDQDEEEEGDEDGEVGEEEEEEGEEEDKKQSNSSLFGSSSCSSSKEAFDDYNGLRKTDESLSDRRRQSSNYEHSSSEVSSFKDDGLLNRSDEKLFSPIFTSSVSFEKDDKALIVAERNESPKSCGKESQDTNGAKEQLASGQIIRIDSDSSLRGLRKTPFLQESEGSISPSKNTASGKSSPSDPAKSSNSLTHVTGGNSGGSNGNLHGPVTRIARPLNQNIRAPQGIPGRDISARKPFINPAAGASCTASSADDEVDTNPLRRLRDSQSGFGRPMMTFRPVGATTNRAVATPGGGVSSHDESSQQNLNVNLSFFDKLKEQESQKLS